MTPLPTFTPDPSSSAAAGNGSGAEPRSTIGPGLPESLLWIGAFGALQIAFLAPTLIVILLARGASIDALTTFDIRSLSATERLLFIGVPLLGTYVVLIPAGLWRMRRNRSPRFRRPRLRFGQVLLISSLILPMSAIADWVYQQAQRLFLELLSEHDGLRLLENFDLTAELSELREAPLWLLAVTIAVLPALGEEFLFRVLIGRGLTSRWGVFAGVLLTSLLFGLVHAFPPHVAAAILMGVVLHIVYLTTGSYGAAALAHFLNNFLAVMTLKFSEENQSAPAVVVLLSLFYVVVMLSLLWASRVVPIAEQSVRGPGNRGFAALRAAGPGPGRRGLTIPRWALVAAGAMLVVQSAYLACALWT